ncbi:MAG: hypothetical protein JOY78_05640 [Pseudonocardia sp.]|nr:hypothetical protein [Pseudonocardia sp.]
MDIIVLPTAVTGLSEQASPLGGYLFDPDLCCLVPLDDPDQMRYRASRQWVTSLLGAGPAALLAFAARPARTLSRYRGGLSLIYRDAGALLATLGLTASALGLACCAVAQVAPTADTTWNETSNWIDAGGIALGSCLA